MDLVERALKDVGYKSTSTKSQYGSRYGMQGYWCVMAVMCWAEDVSLALPVRTASCSAFSAAAKKTNGYLPKGTKTFKRNDIVVLDFPNTSVATDHMAIVVEQIGNYIATVEGNTSSTDGGSQASGGCVAVKLRPVSYVHDGWRPANEDIHEAKPMFVGAKGNIVKLLQDMLKACGYTDQNGAEIAVDGDYGLKTDFALKNYIADYVRG